MLLILATTAMAGTIDRVPQDYASLQEAIDQGDGSTIVLAAGDWAGARLTRSVVIEGEPGARIVSGVRNKDAQIGLILTGAATGSEIAGITFGCGTDQLDLGIYASAVLRDGSPDEIHITQNVFQGCAQAVTNVGTKREQCEAAVDGGQRWVVDGNTFDGFATQTDKGRPVGGIGVYLFNVTENDVYGNLFTGTVDDRPQFTTSGILTAGCHDCILAGNQFEVTGGKYYWSAITNFGSYQDGAASSRRVQLEENDASNDSAPHAGVNFRSYDSYQTRLAGNAGSVHLDHSYCGDGRKVKRSAKQREFSR